MKAIDTASIPVIKANISYKGIAKEMGREVNDAETEHFLPIDITFDDSPNDGSALAIPTPPQHYMQSPVHMDYLPGIAGIPGPLQSLIAGDLGFGFGQDPLMGFG